MLREILAPADLSGAALDELKQWLGITREDEDQQLEGLLHASLAMCEAFTGQTPIEQQAEQALALTGDWQVLASRPVRAITSAELVAEDGTRSALAATEYDIDIDPQGAGSLRWKGIASGRAIAVAFTAGIAPDWASLPDPLRQGIIRLAAFHYRERDMESAGTPPASISALWRPWRLMRLA